ncbi:unnamed protein product [Sphagnum tenellum]
MCGGHGRAARVGAIGGAIVRFGHRALWAAGATSTKRGRVQCPCGGGQPIRALVERGCGVSTRGGPLDLA